MSPQCETVLRHLKTAGSITGVEAAAVHKIRSLPRRILDLKKLGYGITAERKEDATGQRYARYHLTGEAK